MWKTEGAFLAFGQYHSARHITRARLGRVTPLGRPRSIYMTDVECRFLKPNGLEGQGQWPSFSMTNERTPRCILGANLVILAQIHYKLSRGHAKFPRILSQNAQNDLEGQGQWPPFSIPAESIPQSMFGANLVYLGKICCRVIGWTGQIS